MARTLAENDNKVLNNSCFGGGEVATTSDSDLLVEEGETVLEAFLDSALENDQVLRGILEEGLTQIIKAAIRLLKLQRRRDRGQSRGNKEKPVSSSACFGGMEDPSDLPGDEEDEELEAFLDSVLEKDQVLRVILDEGLTQIIRGAIRLFNLQRGRDRGQSQGHRSENRLSPKFQKNVQGFDDRLKNSAVHGDQGSISKGLDNNPPITTMTTVINSEEVDMAHNASAEHADESTFSEGGLKLEGGMKVAPAGKGGKGRERPLKHCCYFCQKTFPIPSLLESHMRTHTGEKPFPCLHCRKEFPRKGDLNVHIRSHMKEKPFKCNLCGKGFTQKKNLEDHIRRHLKEKWFKCPHPGCTSSFVTGGELNQHSRVHSGERPFACSHPGCGKTFSQKSTLTDHSRIHSGEKPFACPHPGCTSSFVNGSKLKRHARVHYGEKPFACKYPNCDKHCSTKDGRDGHHRTHTGEKPFVCGCGKSYAIYVRLYSHRGKCAEGDRATKKMKMCQDDG